MFLTKYDRLASLATTTRANASGRASLATKTKANASEPAPLAKTT